MTKARTPYGPLHADAPDHQKVYKLAAALDISHAHAFGLLCCLWSRALVSAPDGRIHSAEQLKRMASHDGEASHLVDAMLSSGQLVRDGEALAIHDWSHYGGASLARRDQLASNFRGRSGARCPAPIAAPKGAPIGAAIGDLDKHCENVTAIAAPIGAPIAAPKGAAIASNLILSSSDLSSEGSLRETKPRKVRPRGAFGLDEQARAPKTPLELWVTLCEAHPDWRKRLEALDGRSGRKLPIEVLEATWTNFADNVATHGLVAALSRAWGYLLTDAGRSAGQHRADPTKAPAKPPGREREAWRKARGRERMRVMRERARIVGVEVPPFDPGIASAWSEWISSDVGQDIMRAAHESVDAAFEQANGAEPA